MILASDNSESMSIWMSVVLSDLRYNLKKQLIICQAFYSEEKKKSQEKRKWQKPHVIIPWKLLMIIFLSDIYTSGSSIDLTLSWFIRSYE